MKRIFLILTENNFLMDGEDIQSDKKLKTFINCFSKFKFITFSHKFHLNIYQIISRETGIHADAIALSEKEVAKLAGTES